MLLEALVTVVRLFQSQTVMKQAVILDILEKEIKEMNIDDMTKQG